MTKQEVIGEALKLSDADRRDVAASLLSRESVDAVKKAVDKYKPSWAEKGWGRAVIGAGIAVLSFVGAYFYHKVNEPEPAPQVQAEAPAQLPETPAAE